MFNLIDHLYFYSCEWLCRYGPIALLCPGSIMLLRRFWCCPTLSCSKYIITNLNWLSSFVQLSSENLTWRRCNSATGDCNLSRAHGVASKFSGRSYCWRFCYLYFLCLGDHIFAVSVRPGQLGNLSYVWSTFFVYLSYMMLLLMTTKYISSSILTMAPFIFIMSKTS